MKEIVPTPPAIVQSQFAEVRELFNRYVVPSYGRYEIAFSHGAGNHLWDVNGKRYVDFGGGIAVTSLGHCNPEITETLVEQHRSTPQPRRPVCPECRSTVSSMVSRLVPDHGRG